MKPPRTRKLALLQGIRSGVFFSFLFFFFEASFVYSELFLLGPQTW